MISAVRERFHAKSAAVLLSLESHLNRIMIGWLIAAGLACLARILISPTLGAPIGVATLSPYVLVVLAPLVSMIVAMRWFALGDQMPQPELRLARVGRWRQVSLPEARRHPLYGTTGIMVSLLVGMLINIPIRTAEYLVTMPAITEGSPHWLFVLHTLMTLDVVALSSLYAIAFIAALRKVPLFPRLLVAIWMADISMQLVVAQVAAGADLPAAVTAPLEMLLNGNVNKVLISVALWLPYLLLSSRVNVTFRHRIAA
jgi:hypothetical protein